MIFLSFFTPRPFVLPFFTPRPFVVSFFTPAVFVHPAGLVRAA
ncbi:MAG: hypothetical protein ACOCUN_03005 [Jiangellaceae bacterium]